MMKSLQRFNQQSNTQSDNSDADVKDFKLRVGMAIGPVIAGGRPSHFYFIWILIVILFIQLWAQLSLSMTFGATQVSHIPLYWIELNMVCLIVNVASRMDTNGVVGKIHTTQEVANILTI